VKSSPATASEKIKVLFIERKFNEFFSLEKVFRQVAKSIPESVFETSFSQLRFLSNTSGVFRNLLDYRPEPADIYHVTGHVTFIALVLPPEKTVLTVPDLGVLRVRHGLRRLMVKKIFFDWPVRRAGYVTAISQATADDIVKMTGCPPEKVRVIEIPIDEGLIRLPKPVFNAARPLILQVGAAPHKNLPNLIRAIDGLKCRLMILGRIDDETAAMLKEKAIDFENEFEVGEDRIRELYATADIVAFCSTFEGFGLPIIEAQAMGTPVVTSNIDPMKEVAGDGALLADPHSPEEIRAAIDRLIEDSSLREKLVLAGTDNVKRYEPATIAAKYAELYREVYGNNQL